jgi:hypothetical protein
MISQALCLELIYKIIELPHKMWTYSNQADQKFYTQVGDITYELLMSGTTVYRLKIVFPDKLLEIEPTKLLKNYGFEMFTAMQKRKDDLDNTDVQKAIDNLLVT